MAILTLRNLRNLERSFWDGGVGRKYLGFDSFLMPRIAFVDARVLKNSIIVDDNPGQAPFLSEKFGARCCK
jgi:hypothetical protein